MTTTEQPRGSAAYRLQHAINHGNITLNTTPDHIAMFIAVLLAPIHGHDAAIGQTHHGDPTKRRNRLYTKPRPQYGTAQPLETAAVR